jgi:NAD(P)-dependent dehydrogenase (short-subunit alcohol dehydrogenase family)
MGSCQGRVALVTGASQGGTGTAIALRLAAEGARVALTARTESGLQETLRRIEQTGGAGLVLPCDLADPTGGRDTLVERTEAELGPIDLLVNNAAVGAYKPFTEWDWDDVELHTQVNLWAPWLLMKQVVPGMRERGAGSILNLTTFVAELPPGPPFPDALPAKLGAGYGSTKAALNRLTLAVASETEGEGISVNALTPQAAIMTPALIAGGWIEDVWMEPLETMAEAALALLTGDPATLTGRIAFSLQLLLELERPVLGLEGREPIEGWQPADLRAVIDRQTAAHNKNGWGDAYDFHRRSSPVP